MKPNNPPDPDFTSPDEVSGINTPSLSISSYNFSIHNLIALPKEAQSHIDAGHTIFAPENGDCYCSCGPGFRVGIIVDKTTLQENRDLLIFTSGGGYVNK